MASARSFNAATVAQCAQREGGTMARRKSLRSQFYRAARDLGNIEAAEKGPGSYGRRVVRRKVYSRSNGLTGKFLRSLFK